MKGDAAASSAPNNPAGRGGAAAAVAGRLRHGRRRQHGILAAATGARVAVPVLPGAAAWGVVGAIPLVAAVAAAAVGGDAPSGPGVPAVGGVPRRRRGGGVAAAAAAARCALCFLAAFAVTLAVAALDGCDVSVVVQLDRRSRFTIFFGTKLGKRHSFLFAFLSLFVFEGIAT